MDHLKVDGKESDFVKWGSSGHCMHNNLNRPLKVRSVVKGCDHWC